MSADSAALEAPPTPRTADRSLSLPLAAFVSVAITLALAALAFWPARAWVPPQRPTLKGPIVFDEFVDAPSPPPAAPGALDPAMH